MKKLTVVIFIIFSLCLCSCGNSGPSLEREIDENGNNVLILSGQRTTMAQALPCDIAYNSQYITVESVEFYENTVDYSHNLFAVLTLDLSELDDEQVHWLLESDLDVNAYITCEKNDYDFSSATRLGEIHYTDTNKLIVVFASSFFKENRYSFSESNVSVAIEIAQEGEKATFECLQYSADVPENIAPTEDIPKPLQEHIAQWLNKKASSFS